MKMRRERLIGLLKGLHRRGIMVTVYTETIPKLKAGAPDEIIKQSQINGILGFNYEGVVNKRREKEGLVTEKFVAQSLPWGQHIEGTPLIEHKGDLYLQIMINNEKVDYVRKGEFIDIDKFLPKTKVQLNQELLKPVTIKTPAVKNIKALAFNGKFYEVV